MFKKVWDRSPLWYRVFLVIAPVIAIPLVFCVFLYADDPRRSWLVWWSEVGLFAIGLIGAARGFYVYIIKKEPL